MNAKVAAIVVLYYPDVDKLESLLTKIIGQVQAVFLVDNTPEFTETLELIIRNFSLGEFYFALGENKGIATAQNIGIAECKKAAFTHVLLLDQDSSPLPDMVNQLLDAEALKLQAGIQVAAVGPLFTEEKTGGTSFAVQYKWTHGRKIYPTTNDSEVVQSDWLTASGTLTRMAVFDVVGQMEEDLFIDCVDIEWGLRALEMGWMSFVAPMARMDHNVGELAFTVAGRDVILHNDSRHYYSIRNSIYLVLWKNFGWKWKIHAAPRIPGYFLIYIFKSSNPLKSFKLLIKAIWDGITRRLGMLDKPPDKIIPSITQG